MNVTSRMTIPVNQLRKQFSNQVPLSQLQDLIIKVSKELRNKEEQPYWNPYGFLVWKIHEFDDGSILRLHVWPHDGRIVQHPVFPEHSHPWRLHSLILTGGILSENYRIHQDEDDPTHTIYEVEYRGGSSFLGRTDKTARLELENEQDLRAGDYYTIEEELAHAATVDEFGFTATLVLTEMQGSNARVFISEDGSDEYHFKRYSPESHRREKLLNELEERVSSS